MIFLCSQIYVLIGILVDSEIRSVNDAIKVQLFYERNCKNMINLIRSEVFLRSPSKLVEFSESEVLMKISRVSIFKTINEIIMPVTIRRFDRITAKHPELFPFSCRNLLNESWDKRLFKKGGNPLVVNWQPTLLEEIYHLHNLFCWQLLHSLNLRKFHNSCDIMLKIVVQKLNWIPITGKVFLLLNLWFVLMWLIKFSGFNTCNNRFSQFKFFKRSIPKEIHYSNELNWT